MRGRKGGALSERKPETRSRPTRRSKQASARGGPVALMEVPRGYETWLSKLKESIAPTRDSCGESRAGSALLAHRTRHPPPTGPGGVGHESCRAARARSSGGVPRHEGFFPAEPEVHALVRVGLAGLGIRAASCCTIAVVPPLHPPRQAEQQGAAGLVHGSGCRARLVSGHSGDADRNQRHRARRACHHELLYSTA